MTRAIAGNKGSTMWCGSEFRPPDELKELPNHHDCWDCLEKNMRERIKDPMPTLPEKKQIK
eukprot:14299689-Ditylum_brightwellii.AAC.1